MRTDASRPSRRCTRTPPGRWTGPWPCHSVTRASSAATCRCDSARRQRAQLPGPGVQHPGTLPRAGNPAESAARTSPAVGAPGRGPAPVAGRASSSAAVSRPPAGRSAPGCPPPPGPSARTSAGSTSARTRARAYAGSALCGSSHGVSPSAAQAVRVSAPGRRPAAGAAAAPRPGPGGRASRPALVGRRPGPARAAPSRPGRRGCGRAAPRPRRAAGPPRRAPGSAPRGRPPPGHRDGRPTVTADRRRPARARLAGPAGHRARPARRSRAAARGRR